MKITYLELVGYRRFKLARLHRLVYRPTARQQLILGTNGSGKSSLLDELSPLPARPADYRTGGLKLIHLEHGAHQFELRSSFAAGNKHSFKRDDIELNEGGTFQVQQRLVKEHFNYTDKLHDLLIGRTRFTELRSQERREWITQLSETDWTYALGLYQQLKSKARDALGAFRHQQSRLAQESENLSANTDLEAYRARFLELRTELNQLLIEIVPHVPELRDLNRQLEERFERIDSTSRVLLENFPECMLDGQYLSLLEIDDEIQEVRSSLDLRRFTLERSSNDYSELESILASFGGRKMEQIDNVDEQLTQTESELSKLQASPRTFTLQQAASIQQDSDLALSELTNLFHMLPDNSVGKFSRKASEEAQQRIEALQREVDSLSTELNRAHNRLSHLKGTHDSKCPHCQYVWKEGVNPEELTRLEQVVLKLPQSIEEQRRAIGELRGYLEEAQAYSAHWQRFRALHNSYPRLLPLFQYILAEDLLINRPNENLGVLITWRDDLKLAQAQEHLQERLAHLQQIKRTQAQFGEASKLSERMQQLEHEIAEITPQIADFNQQLQVLTKRRTEMHNFIIRYNQLDSEMSSFVQLMEQAVTSIRNDLLNEQVSVRHLEMSSIQKKLTDRETLQGIVNDLKLETEKLELRSKAFQLLAATLSPTEGIIAERLRDAIFSIIEQMNTVIASVWTHELRILECGVEGADLDYRFPVQVETPEDVSADISKCSKGQMEMINIAFKLTAMLYLNMLDFPLYLDEPGEGFDEQHRDQIMSLIRQMLDSGHYSQLFMVSHIASNHGAFFDAQSLVLESSNITLPGRFNEHATLE